jgi:L-fuconolactonase
MPDRADAHIHLFDGGYQGESLAARPGVRLDEVALFESLMVEHGITAALVVGYAGASWCKDNNRFLAAVVRDHQWIHPTAYLEPADLNVAVLRRLATERFVGVSLYLFNNAATDALAKVADETWTWLTQHRWVVSVNSKGKTWAAWRPILQRHPMLRVLASHLGLPPAVDAPPEAQAAESALADVLALAEFEGPRVKLSGFYALTTPGHDYPHRAAWPYVQALTRHFGIDRLVWASDFSPCLDWLTYPQTLGLFDHMSWLDATARTKIEGGNLLALLGEARG